MISPSRRSGFPRVLQHDILGSSKIVGGPLLDLDGRCLGMNIARANRAESFAIPVEDLKDIAARLLKQAKPAKPALIRRICRRDCRSSKGLRRSPQVSLVREMTAQTWRSSATRSGIRMR